MSKSNSEQRPTLMPPQNMHSKGAASGKTTPMNTSSAASSETKKRNGSGKEHLSPTMPPPSPTKPGEAAKLGDAAVGGVAAWSPAATVEAVWCINEDKNTWIKDPAVGWKQLSNLSDSVNVALTMLSSHAKQKGSTVYYRTEDDGTVHEMYVW